jgi:glycosyltransferase involved in cell wall biosynthesis
LHAVRVAFVRGPNLNPWELQNLNALSGQVTAFASRRGHFAAHDPGVAIEIRRLPCPRDVVARLPRLAEAAVMRFTGSLDHLVGLERALRGFDVAHVAELHNPYSLQAVRARDRGAVRRVVATVWENIPFLPPENPLVARRARRVAETVDHFVAITARSRLHLNAAGVEDDRITVQPMGIDLDRFRPARGRRVGGGPLEILCVARLVPEKGVEDLVQAVALLRDRGVPARATFVGTGPGAGRLREQAQRLGVGDAVVLRGGLPYTELPAMYQASDVFVLASGPRTTWREQFGFAVVEAMGCGLPVLAGRSGSLPDVVVDEESLVTPHDPVELADRLAALAADPEERRRRGERNRAIAEERYDRRAVGEALRAVYERTLAS